MKTGAHSIELLARFALKEMQDSVTSIEFIEDGSTSSAYRIRGEASDYVLRVPAIDGRKRATYESDFAIRQALAHDTDHVAGPLLTNEVVNDQRFGPWALDTFCRGTNPDRGKLPSKVARQLGALLRALHSLPVSGFGSLTNTRSELRGRFESRATGVLSRFESPWPFSNGPLAEHPCTQSNKRLVGELLALESDLREFVEQGEPSIVHSDLHEKQFLMDNDELVAVLDFNEAVALRSQWDLGSVLYFHGSECLEEVLHGYAPGAENDSSLIGSTRLAAILIALHHGNRGAILARPHRIESATAFLSAELL
ncbi:MAG: aminoglycoside phosphotransferase family protein [Pseudomonadota bacterium]